MDYYKIGIPPGTRLMSLMRGSFAGVSGWLVWIAINDVHKNPSFWLGTYLFCSDEGGVIRVTVNADGTEDVMPIKNADVREEQLTTHLTTDDLPAFEAAYNQAIAEGKSKADVFVFREMPFVIGYAFYVIEYLKNKK